MFTVLLRLFVFHQTCVISVWGSIYSDPHCANGRSAITHLFEWKWKDIAAECERFLGPYGYCGVQISPPNENRVIPPCFEPIDQNESNNNGSQSSDTARGPWFERYQPVSYKLNTRSGTEQDLVEMIQRCNKVGVRIYADVVINHMAVAHITGHGTAETPFDSIGLQFPGIPYGPGDFNDGTNCHTRDLNIHSYYNIEEVRNCRLEKLLDLRLGKEYVRHKVVQYLNRLLDLGVAGFRVDSAKHMWPEDLVSIFGRLKSLRAEVFGEDKKPFIFQEVIDLDVGEPIKGDNYLHTGRVTNFIYGKKLSEVFRRENPMKYLSNWGRDWGMLNSEDVVVFIDNHDNQRGHGGKVNILTHKTPRVYRAASAFMLAHPYGVPRVMSSYTFQTPDQGPPHHADMATESVSVHGDMTCGKDWTCEHRWRQMYNMVAFRNIAGYSGVSNWWSGSDYQIAFSRGNKAFIAFNLEHFDMDIYLNTGLPQGLYCDVISGNLVKGKCTGSTLEVDQTGRSRIVIRAHAEDDMLAIHIGAKVEERSQRVNQERFTNFNIFVSYVSVR